MHTKCANTPHKEYIQSNLFKFTKVHYWKSKPVPFLNLGGVDINKISSHLSKGTEYQIVFFPATTCLRGVINKFENIARSMFISWSFSIIFR